MFYRRKRRRRQLISILMLSFVLMAMMFTTGATSAFTQVFAAEKSEDESLKWHYFNDDVNSDDIGTNNFNFGPDRKAWADAAVAKGEATSVQDYIAKNDATGDFFESISVDRALLSAIAAHMDEQLEFDEKILADEQNVLIGQRVDAAHKHMLEDDAYYSRVLKLVEERLCLGEISINKLSDYTSAMYMYPKRLDGSKPSVVVRNTTNAGGTFIQFDLGKPGKVRFRLECGYQPVDVDYWPVPKNPEPINDNPTPVTPEPENPTPETPTPETPTPEKPTPETPEPEKPTPEQPTPETPAPKDPNAGPNAQIDDPEEKADFGGGANDPDKTDKTITEEPQSPDSYVASDSPKAEDTQKPEETKKQEDGQKPEETKSSEEIKQPDTNPADDYREKEKPATEESKKDTVVTEPSKSGSETVNTDNGKTGTTDDGKDYTVQAGDGQKRQDLSDVQAQHEAADDVEPAVADDGVNVGDDIDPDSIN